MMQQALRVDVASPPARSGTSPDPLAFGKRPIASLVTACASELEFLAIDAGHAVFALNHGLYRMTRVATANLK